MLTDDYLLGTWATKRPLSGLLIMRDIFELETFYVALVTNMFSKGEPPLTVWHRSTGIALNSANWTFTSYPVCWVLYTDS